MVISGTTVIMFGGRDEETQREHSPRTFDMEYQQGVRSFTTYEDKPLYSCIANLSGNITNIESSGSTYYGQCQNTVPVGVYYNDVWSYELNCTR